MRHTLPPISEFAFDMRNHFARKLDVLMNDTLETCKTGGATPVEGILVVSAPMVNAACSILLVAGCSEADLLEIVREAYRNAKIDAGKPDHQRETARQ